MDVSAITSTPPLSVLDLLRQNTATAKVKANDATSSTAGGSGLTSTVTGTTFLSLLVKELQNQDPSAPMDSTAMVGQMISLNQLDQLISINQNLTPTSTSTTTSTPTGKSSTSANSADLLAERAALQNSVTSPLSAQAATLAASDPSTALDFSTLNTLSGGK